MPWVLESDWTKGVSERHVGLVACRLWWQQHGFETPIQARSTSDVPDAFALALVEPAFSMSNVTFCIWRLDGEKA